MVGPQHDKTKHPVTGKPMTSNEMNVPDAEGEVTRIVSDKRGRTVIVYRDGRMLTRTMEAGEVVFTMHVPQLTLRPVEVAQ